MVYSGMSFSQIAFSSFSTSNITATSASLNAYVTINCANGGNFHVQYSTSASFSPATNVTGGSVFVSYPRTINLSNLLPSTTYYWRYFGNLGTNCNQTVIYSPTQTFTTTAAAQAPTIVSLSEVTNGTSSVTVNYSLTANGSSTTSIVRYGISPGALTNQVGGFSTSVVSATNGSAILTGLSLDTTYHYQIEATNSTGTTTSPIFSFVNLAPQNTHEYTFNNTFNNTIGGNPFVSNNGTSFVMDRNGNANSALYINNTGSTASMPGLPYGNSPRTFSVWVKLNTLNGAGYNFIFCYGNGTNFNGAYINGSSVNYFGTGANQTAASLTGTEWNHFVFSYDGTNAKTYKNGILLDTSAKNWMTGTNNNLFTLGLTEGGLSGYFDGTIDDLKIYNFAVTDTEAANLYTYNTLAAQDLAFQNLKVIIYPNPASDHFAIETGCEIQSVEIYSAQGQKVLASTDKNINVSHLSKGMYLVRIKGSNNAVATQKLILK